MEIGQGFSFGLGVIFTFYFFLYIKSSCVLLFVVFLMEKGNEKLFLKKPKTNAMFVIIGILKILVLSMNHIVAIVVMV